MKINKIIIQKKKMNKQNSQLFQKGPQLAADTTNLPKCIKWIKVWCGEDCRKTCRQPSRVHCTFRKITFRTNSSQHCSVFLLLLAILCTLRVELITLSKSC